MMRWPPMFEVWFSVGRGRRILARYRRLDDAVRHVAELAQPGSYAIRLPEGRWHEWPDRRLIRRVS